MLEKEPCCWAWHTCDSLPPALNSLAVVVNLSMAIGAVSFPVWPCRVLTGCPVRETECHGDHQSSQWRVMLGVGSGRHPPLLGTQTWRRLNRRNE